MSEARRPVRVVVVGLGAIGTAVAEECLGRSDFEVVAAVDLMKAGSNLGRLTIQDSLTGLSRGGADVALVATGSSLDAAAGQFELAASLGLDVVSTCEELAYPWALHVDVGGRLDEAARAEGVRLLGCGVNPGFVMDALPVLLGTASLDAKSIRVTRKVDLDRRRPQLADKLGAGLDEGSWRQRAAGESFGHRGLIESAHLCALGAGWDVDGVEFSREPILRDGIVIGVREAVGLRASEGRSVSLDLAFETGGKDLDLIEVDGSPPLRAVFEGGVQGDRATVALMLHCARTVGGLPPGLRLPIEVPGWTPPR